MSDPPESFSFVIPTHGRPEVLRRTLDALQQLDYQTDRLEVVVVNDGPDVKTRRVVGGFADAAVSVRYLEQASAGAASARNTGARLAQGTFLNFLDDDMIVEPSHVREHVAGHATYGRCLIGGDRDFTPEVLQELQSTPFGRFRIEVEDRLQSGIGRRPLDGRRLQPAMLSTYDLSIRRALFFELGGFDESFPVAGTEDTEFSYRAVAADCLLVQDPAIRLLHEDIQVNLKRFCNRQCQHGRSAVYLAAKLPGDFADHPLIRENSALSPRDGPHLWVKKLVKTLLATAPLLSAGHALVTLLERLFPAGGRPLTRAYSAMLGLYTFRGVRDGLTELNIAACFTASAVRQVNSQHPGADHTSDSLG